MKILSSKDSSFYSVCEAVSNTNEEQGSVESRLMTSVADELCYESY